MISFFTFRWFSVDGICFKTSQLSSVQLNCFIKCKIHLEFGILHLQYEHPFLFNLYPNAHVLLQVSRGQSWVVGRTIIPDRFSQKCGKHLGWPFSHMHLVQESLIHVSLFWYIILLSLSITIQVLLSFVLEHSSLCRILQSNTPDEHVQFSHFSFDIHVYPSGLSPQFPLRHLYKSQHSPKIINRISEILIN